MTIETFGPLAICTDCLMWAANGWDLDEPFPSELLDNPDANAGWELGCGWSADDDDEGSFSWSPCDWCRRPLGGDRYPAHVFRDVAPDRCEARCRFCAIRCERRAGHYPATVHECEGETWEDPGRPVVAS